MERGGQAERWLVEMERNGGREREKRERGKGEREKRQRRERQGRERGGIEGRER